MSGMNFFLQVSKNKLSGRLPEEEKSTINLEIIQSNSTVNEDIQ